MPSAPSDASPHIVNCVSPSTAERLKAGGFPSAQGGEHGNITSSLVELREWAKPTGAGLATGRSASPMAKNGPIRDQRRRELIQATIAVIARHGYSGTTVARVARKAGVSTGLMNFHFDSKDRLFRATFDFLAAEYQQVWDRNLTAAGDGPAARVTAMIESYFDRRVFTGDKLAVWFTFWSDAELRDRYRASAMRKLNISSTAELVRYAIRTKLIGL